MFNEVFFDDVFVPEDCLVGQEHDGWRAARTTLANERVYMGSSNTIGSGVVGVLALIERSGLADDRLALAVAGGLVATGHALVRARVPSHPRRAWPAPTRRARKLRCASSSACSTTSTSKRSG